MRYLVVDHLRARDTRATLVTLASEDGLERYTVVVEDREAPTFAAMCRVALHKLAHRLATRAERAKRRRVALRWRLARLFSRRRVGRVRA